MSDTLKPEVLPARLRPVISLMPMLLTIAAFAVVITVRIVGLATESAPVEIEHVGLTTNCPPGEYTSLRPGGTWACSGPLPSGGDFGGDMTSSGDLRVGGRLFVRGVEVCNGTDTTRIVGTTAIVPYACVPARAR